jgi:hypothetical protein
MHFGDSVSYVKDTTLFCLERVESAKTRRRTHFSTVQHCKVRLCSLIFRDAIQLHAAQHGQSSAVHECFLALLVFFSRKDAVKDIDCGLEDRQAANILAVEPLFDVRRPQVKTLQQEQSANSVIQNRKQPKVSWTCREIQQPNEIKNIPSPSI